MKSFLTVSGESTAEYSEKRSRFIATLRHCATEQEALRFIEEMRSKYHDARHNVFAYSVSGGIKRFSDDGEPHGTAGKPMLEIIEGSGITDVAVVVTRYFGGVLLGTGGLFRAYSAAVRDALAGADIVEMISCTSFSTVCDYTDHARLVSLVSGCGGTVENTVFTENVTVSYYFKSEECDGFLKKLCETFAARLLAVETVEKLIPVSKKR